MLFFVALKITAGRRRRPAVIKKRSKATALNLKLQTPVRSPVALSQAGIIEKSHGQTPKPVQGRFS